jgi:hypothetical protein
MSLRIAKLPGLLDIFVNFGLLEVVVVHFLLFDEVFGIGVGYRALERLVYMDHPGYFCSS